MNKIKQTIEEIMYQFSAKFDSRAFEKPKEVKVDIVKMAKAFTDSQHKLLDVLVEELEGEKFADSSQGGQFGLHIDGYNQAIEDIIALIKAAKE